MDIVFVVVVLYAWCLCASVYSVCAFVFPCHSPLYLLKLGFLLNPKAPILATVAGQLALGIPCLYLLI